MGATSVPAQLRTPVLADRRITLRRPFRTTSATFRTLPNSAWIDFLMTTATSVASGTGHGCLGSRLLAMLRDATSIEPRFDQDRRPT